MAYDLFRTLIIGSACLLALGCGDDGDSSGAGGGGGGAPSSGGSKASSGGAFTSGGVPTSGGSGSGGKAGSAPVTNGGGGSTASGGSDGGPSGGSGVEFVGNITTGFNNGMDQGNRKFSTYWDQVTPENAGKWGSVQSNMSGGFNWSALDAIYDYAEKNRIIFKQHTFVWGSQQPSGNVTAEAVQKWMTEFCQRYPNTKLIDVVNEPPPHTRPSYDGAIGGGTDGDWKWITNSFIWARQACPNAILILNDYNNIEWPNDNAHFIDIVKKVKAAGAPIDAVGAQAHDLDNGGVRFDTVKSLLEKLHQETGLPVYITEMDIDSSDDGRQLELYQQYFPLFRQQSYIKGITIWGWIYGQTWQQAPNSGLIRNGQPRSAMGYLMNELGRPAP